MKKFFQKMKLHKTWIFLIICAVVVGGCVLFVVFSVFNNQQDSPSITTPLLVDEKNSKEEKNKKSEDDSKDNIDENSIDNNKENKGNNGSDATNFSSSASTYDYDAEMKRIEDEYNENMRKSEEEYNKNMQRIEDEYNEKMKSIEQNSGTKESEEKLRQALEEAQRMEEQAQIEAANVCPNTHSQSYAQYQQAVSSANSIYNSTVSNIQCSSFGGCPARANAERTRDQAILSAKNTYKSQMLAVGCDPSDYVDW